MCFSYNIKKDIFQKIHNIDRTLTELNTISCIIQYIYIIPDRSGFIFFSNLVYFDSGMSCRNIQQKSPPSCWGSCTSLSLLAYS